MAYGDPTTFGENLAQTKSRWAALSRVRRILIVVEVVASLVLIWSLWADPSKTAKTAIWMVWAMALLAATWAYVSDALGKRRAEQNTLEGTE